MFKYEYQQQIENLATLDKRLSVEFDSFNGIIKESGSIFVIFKGELSSAKKTQLDSLMSGFKDEPDEVLEIQSASFERKRAGARFDDFSIAVLSSEGFGDDIDVAIMKYQGFNLVRQLIKDGLFHYALRVFVRDIMPSPALTDAQKAMFRGQLRGLVGLYYPDYNADKLEAGES